MEEKTIEECLMKFDPDLRQMNTLKGLVEGDWNQSFTNVKLQ